MSAIALVIHRMAAGDKVQALSIDLADENASGFVTLFEKVMSKPPSHFLADQQPPAQN